MEPRGTRTFIAISLCCALSISLAFLFPACERKTDPLAALRTFFELIAAGKAQQAYAETAFGFQASENEKSFETTVGDLGLADYLSLQSEPPKIEGNSATLRLEIATRAGKRLPFVVTMTDESGAWRVFTIRSPRDSATGVAENRFTILGKAPKITETTLPDPPNEKETRRLVRENLLAFDKAVADGSFKDFYESLSVKWRDQITEDQLQKTFQPFVDHQFHLSEIKDTEAVFDGPAAFDRDGLLIVSGYYPTQPIRTVFFFKFAYDLPKWKLTDIGRSTSASGSAIMDYPSPGGKELQELIRQNILAFDSAIADRSFKAFYRDLSEKWKGQLTEEQLEKAFQPFIEHQYRVSDAADTEAVLDAAPALDSEGMLILSGHYPTRPFKTIFSLKFTYELPRWKLFGIEVNLQQ